jgi:hypothetical protein
MSQPKDIDTNALKDEMSTGSRHPQGESEKVSQDDEQRKKARTTAKTASEPPPDLVVPTEDWVRTWTADKTIMLRMTSKGVKELLDKNRPPAGKGAFWRSRRRTQ